MPQRLIDSRAPLHWREGRPSSETPRMTTPQRCGSSIPLRSAFAGFRFPPDVIVIAVRWYLRYALPYRDAEELLIERGVQADRVTIYRWVLRFTPLLAEAARPCWKNCCQPPGIAPTGMPTTGLRFRLQVERVERCPAYALLRFAVTNTTQKEEYTRDGWGRSTADASMGGFDMVDPAGRKI